MTKPLRVLAATAVAALALGGCSHGAATAATVGGTQLSTGEVAAISQAVGPMLGKTPQAIERSVVQARLEGLIAGQIAAQHDIPLTDAQRAKLIDANAVLKAVSTNPDGLKLANGLADQLVVAETLGAEKWMAACASVDVTVNPLYGPWSKEMCSLVPNGTGSLSRSSADG